MNDEPDDIYLKMAEEILRRHSMNLSKREAIQNEHGWLVKVTPPEWSSYKTTFSMQLSNEQYARYVEWVANRDKLVHEVFPELSNREREGLLAGIVFDDRSRQ